MFSSWGFVSLPSGTKNGWQRHSLPHLTLTTPILWGRWAWETELQTLNHPMSCHGAELQFEPSYPILLSFILTHAAKSRVAVFTFSSKSTMNCTRKQVPDFWGLFCTYSTVFCRGRSQSSSICTNVGICYLSRSTRHGEGTAAKRPLLCMCYNSGIVWFMSWLIRTADSNLVGALIKNTIRPSWLSSNGAWRAINELKENGGLVGNQLLYKHDPWMVLGAEFLWTLSLSVAFCDPTILIRLPYQKPFRQNDNANEESHLKW